MDIGEQMGTARRTDGEKGQTKKRVGGWVECEEEIRYRYQPYLKKGINWGEGAYLPNLTGQHSLDISSG